jgi:SAM-dependent methyltransferase
MTETAPRGSAGDAPACLLRGGTDADRVFRRTDLDYLRCRRCGLLYVDYLAAPVLSTNRQLFGDERPRYWSNPARRQLHVRRTVRALEYLARKGRQGAILEIGCSEGFFLSVARDHGWQVQGWEAEPAAAERGRAWWGLGIYCGPPQSVPWPECSFDVVYMSSVLEHLLNPIEMLTAARQSLRPGGLLHIRTGNVGCYSFRVLSADWPYLDFPTQGHLAFYSPATVRHALEQAGFPPARIRIRTSGIHACRKQGSYRQRVLAALLQPWSYLSKQGDHLRVDAWRAPC